MEKIKKPAKLALDSYADSDDKYLRNFLIPNIT